MSSTLLENPSLATGFAPRDGEPRYPSLWRSCVGAWYPGLGVQGSKVFDWAGRRRDGTLTNMAAGSDWVAGKRGLALDFTDGTDDYVDTGSGITGAGEAIAVSFWFYPRVDDAGIITKGTSRGTDSERDWDVFGDGTELRWKGRSSSTSSIWDIGATYPSLNEWHHVVAYWDGTTDAGSVKLFIDGEEVASGSASDTSLGDRFNVFIGGRENVGLDYGGLLDDILIYDRAPTPSGIFLLSLRPGIAYELAETTPLRVSATTQVHTPPVATMTTSGVLPSTQKTFTSPLASFSATGQIANTTKTISAPTASTSVTGVGPGTAKTETPPRGSVGLSGVLPGSAKRADAPGPASTSLVGVVPGQAKRLTPPRGSIGLAGLVPGIAKRAGAPTASLSLVGIVGVAVNETVPQEIVELGPRGTNRDLPDRGTQKELQPRGTNRDLPER